MNVIGLRSAKQFYKDNHIDSVKAVINERSVDATMFGMQCSVPYYFKFITGVLHTLSTIDKKTWYSTGYVSLIDAYSHGVIPIYSIESLLTVLKENETCLVL